MANLWRRILTFSYHLLQGQSFIHIDYDAKNFYDRIITEVASLSSAHMGIHPQNAQLLARLLQPFLRHVFIDNPPYQRWYGDSSLLRIRGVGLVMGWSPTIWSLGNNITF